MADMDVEKVSDLDKSRYMRVLRVAENESESQIIVNEMAEYPVI